MGAAGGRVSKHTLRDAAQDTQLPQKKCPNVHEEIVGFPKSEGTRGADGRE